MYVPSRNLEQLEALQETFDLQMNEGKDDRM